MHKLLLQLAVFMSLGMLCLIPAFADEQDDTLFALLKEAPEFSAGDHPLVDQYLRVDTEVRGFVPKQTMLEMQRLLEHDRKEGLTTFSDETLSRLLPPGCLPTTAGGTSTVQNTTKGINDVTHYQKKCEDIMALNKRFAEKLSSIRYQNIFTDGDPKNSGFDLLEDVSQLQQQVDGAKGKDLPGWTRDISPDAKYLTGNWYKPEYVQASTESLADTLKRFSFVATDKNNLGYCPLPGTIPTSTTATPTFTDPEKEAIAKSFARFERAKTTPDPSFDNEAVLKKDTSSVLNAAQEKIKQGVQNLDKWNCLLESFCIKIRFETGFAEEGNPIVRTRLADHQTPAMRSSLYKLGEAVTELSAQNLQVKNEPRAIFSFGWQDLKFEVPDNFLHVSWVPLVPRVDKADFVNAEMVVNLRKIWEATVAISNASDGVASADTATADYATQYANMLTKQKQTEELSIALQAKQIQAKNLTTYESVVGGQLIHLNEELGALLTHMQALKKISKNFASTKIQHN